jgi:hypothetical protein
VVSFGVKVLYPGERAIVPREKDKVVSSADLVCLEKKPIVPMPRI